jgi:hypothetical protein
MTALLEYQVSASVREARHHFASFADAEKYARSRSCRQPHPVYIEIYDVNTQEYTPTWYTMTRGKLERFTTTKETAHHA